MNKPIKENRTVSYPKVELFYDHIMTTAFKRTITESGIILAEGKGNIETKQIVVAAGPNAAVTVGDEVEINPERFPVKMQKARYDVGPDVPVVQVPIEFVDGIPYLFMSTRELKYKYVKDNLGGFKEMTKPEVYESGPSVTDPVPNILVYKAGEMPKRKPKRI